MWVEILTEIVPGLVVLGYVVLWWQAHLDLLALRRKLSELVTTLSEAESWDEASTLLKDYAEMEEK